jgi:hypothetical protein
VVFQPCREVCDVCVQLHFKGGLDLPPARCRVLPEEERGIPRDEWFVSGNVLLHELTLGSRRRLSAVSRTAVVLYLLEEGTLLAYLGAGDGLEDVPWEGREQEARAGRGHRVTGSGERRQMMKTDGGQRKRKLRGQQCRWRL